MPSERVQRNVDQLLDEAQRARNDRDWALVQDLVRQVLRLDPKNGNALDYLAAAERDPRGATGAAGSVAEPLLRGDESITDPAP